MLDRMVKYYNVTYKMHNFWKPFGEGTDDSIIIRIKTMNDQIKNIISQRTNNSLRINIISYGIDLFENNYVILEDNSMVFIKNAVSHGVDVFWTAQNSKNATHVYTIIFNSSNVYASNVYSCTIISLKNNFISAQKYL